MDVIIVCHTEFGFVSDKSVVYDKSHKEGTVVGVANLIKLADKYGAKVTFAVCPEVADYFPQNTKHEIGLHIHPGWEEYENKKGFKWIAGDEYLKKSCKQSSASTVLWDYPYEDQAEMVRMGRVYIKERLGAETKVFVAGRWCLNNDTIKALIKNGFTHDCSAFAHSVSSHYDWSKLSRICMPYHPSENDYQEQGSLPILELPISQYFPRGNVNPEAVPAVGTSWLKACFLEYYKQRAPLFHICLHSPAMTDDYFISAMDDLVYFISKHKDIEFKFVSEIKGYSEHKISNNIFLYLLNINKNIFKSGIKKIFKFKNERFGY